MKILIGSYALKLHKICQREPADIDLLVAIGDTVENCDCVPIPEKLLYKIPYCRFFNCAFPGATFNILNVATLDALLTIKCSHFHLDDKWLKTKQDVLLLQHKGAKVLPTLFSDLKKYWNETKGKKKEVSLKMSKQEFFATGNFKYDHDQLHIWASPTGVPVYTTCLKDGEEVLIDIEKFKSLSFDRQVQMIKEEIAVIAAERFLIPNKGNYSTVVAWSESLRKAITSLMKGYFSEFIIFNLVHFIHPDVELLQNISNQLHSEDQFMNKPDSSEVLTELKSMLENLEDKIDAVVWGVGLPEGVALVEQDGGGEGGGEYCHSVFSYKDKFFKLEYSYYSYHGYDNVDIDELREVKPEQKTITVYN